MKRFSALTAGVIPTAGLMLAVVLVGKPQTSVMVTLILAYVVLACAGLYSWLRLHEQRQMFLLERQKLGLEEKRIDLEWRKRQQHSYDLQASLGDTSLEDTAAQDPTGFQPLRLVSPSTTAQDKEPNRSSMHSSRRSTTKHPSGGAEKHRKGHPHGSDEPDRGEPEHAT